eukprot:g1981.t1
MSSVLDLSGIWAPMCTPFTADGTIDLPGLRLNIQRYNETGLAGLVMLGSNGENALLSEDERVAVVREARAALAPGKLLLAGIGHESTVLTIEQSRRMADAGADAALLLPPFYFKAAWTPPVVQKHATDVADASPVPLVLYSIPSRTGIDFTAAMCVALASHDNIIGIKESGGNITKLTQVAARVPRSSFQCLSGSAGFLLPALSIGCVGGICALANVAPAECCGIVEHFQKGELAEARALQLRIADANAAVTARFGIPGLKHVLDRLGYVGGPVRAPLQPLTDAQQQAVVASVEVAGILGGRTSKTQKTATATTAAATATATTTSTSTVRAPAAVRVGAGKQQPLARL